MLFKEIIYLVSVAYTANDYGDLVESESTKKVFANKKSVGYNEFYQANAQGIKPELIFTIREVEYSDQPKIKYNNKYYNIIRVFTKGEDFIDLTCEGIVGTEVK